MNANDLVFIGLKAKVAALSKKDGSIVWEAALKTGLGGDFVTLHVDGPHVFAYTYGHVACLETLTGRRLWENGLPGYGYGYASLATTSGSSSPVQPAMLQTQQQSSSTDTSHSTS
jgi:outer membrane protein assembly factor BamB